MLPAGAGSPSGTGTNAGSYPYRSRFFFRLFPGRALSTRLPAVAPPPSRDSGFATALGLSRTAGAVKTRVVALGSFRRAAIELGVEGHWRKISLVKPHIIGATVNMEYNFGSNVLGYKAGAWMKRGRINLTYGANISYYTNFNEGHRFGVGPSVGFRLLGFHLVNGFNFLTADKSGETSRPVAVNPLYVSLRYYFPVQNRFVWDRQTRQRKKERQKAREERREKGEGGIFRIFKKKSEMP